MKTIKTSLILLLSLFVYSCSSTTSDEPDMPYDGPWIIYYDESYYGIYKRSAEFEEWFDNHLQNFESAYFRQLDGTTWEFSCDDDFPLLSDYNEWYMGDIVWTEIIQKATEDEIKSTISKFEAFTFRNDKKRIYDDYKATYAKYDNIK